jgi:hypothetical protein
MDKQWSILWGWRKRKAGGAWRKQGRKAVVEPSTSVLMQEPIHNGTDG